jgi:hypothetical protein
MKKISTTLVVLLVITQIGYAQNNTYPWPSSGNIGIGTSIPAAWASQYKILDLFSYGFIYGSSNGTGYGSPYGQTGWGNNSYYNGTSRAVGTGSASMLGQGAGTLTFLNAPSVSAGSTQTFTERFRVDINGYIGVGTTTPQSRLDVQGSTSTEWIRVQSNAGGSGGAVDLYSSGTGGFNPGTVGINTIGTPLALNIGGLEAMRVINGGIVGIGTVTPDPAYKLSVNGKIRSKEIKVETTWSDYVFDKDYQLRPIMEVEAYIKKNHHLPDIPSGAEVEKNGVNLGETSSLLLKKIEELTLYLIEKDKQVKQQETRIDALEKALIKLNLGK